MGAIEWVLFVIGANGIAFWQGTAHKDGIPYLLVFVIDIAFGILWWGTGWAPSLSAFLLAMYALYRAIGEWTS